MISRMAVVDQKKRWQIEGVLAVLVVGIAISFFLSLQAGIWWLFFAVLARWVWLHPLEGFTFLIIVAPVLPMLKITQSIGTVTLAKDVIIVTLLSRLYVWPLITKRLPYRRNILFVPAAVLSGWAVMAMMRADSFVLGVLRARDIILYALLYLVVLYLPFSRQALYRLFRWWLLSVGVVLVLGWYQWFVVPDSAVLRFDPSRAVWIPRLSGVMAHPSIFGQYMVGAALLVVAIILTFRGRARMLAGFGFIALLPSIYLTYSRAVWLGLVGGLVMVMLLYGVGLLRRQTVWSLRRPLLAGLFGTVIVGVLLFRFTSIGVFVRSAVDPTYASNAERLEFLARLVAPLSNSEAIVGRGLGDVTEQNFREISVTSYEIISAQSRSVQLAKNATLVDNQYLKTFVEMGLVGLLIYAWLFWLLLRGAWQTYRTSDSNLDSLGDVRRVIGLWVFGFGISFMVQAIFIDIWDIWPTNGMWWILAGLVSLMLTPSALERHVETSMEVRD